MADLTSVAESGLDGVLMGATGLPVVTADRLFCDGVPWEKLRKWPALATLLVLVVINFVVIFGNLLIIAAVLASNKLRTVTNYFVISLAVADLLVGLTVMPYSITLEVFQAWPFGSHFCKIWLAVDVWLCTSSILNLCAISVDRYLAITRPIRYRSLMSSKRAHLLIVLVWVTAFLICFPPLVGWNDLDDTSAGAIVDGKKSTTTIPSGSPAGGEESDGDSLSGDFATQGVLLNETGAIDHCKYPGCKLVNNFGYVVYSAMGSFYIPMFFMLFFNYRIYVSAIRTGQALERGFIMAKNKGGASSSNQMQQMTLRVHRGNAKSSIATNQASVSETCIVDGIVTGRRRQGAKNSLVPETRSAPPSFKGNADLKGSGSKRRSSSAKTNGQQPTEKENSHQRKTSSSNKKSLRWQARRFRTEAKATKTVGSIVGAFICCWLPFFTVYLVKAFCETCIHDIVFGVFFWLGYLNSALNPLIYALVSKDFRHAFKKILCRCCLKRGGISSLIKQVHQLTVLDDVVNTDEDVLPSAAQPSP
ncbi:probable G-protein coupled receptor No9 [Varroa jacobsoni]|uniref:G-protein coupled receptors family 1 profile domain-containing protein n=1 Tax=Varroa destructor TaxID=109461 RepID=A0A7M7MJ14_VARDE|nr:probable G-protein coupled receptor No9 [Varroa destructor]XP_022706537.1 probable G-protein coupled receptor No9 [Varroa jacobsoni]